MARNFAPSLLSLSSLHEEADIMMFRSSIHLVHGGEEYAHLLADAAIANANPSRINNKCSRELACTHGGNYCPACSEVWSQLMSQAKGCCSKANMHRVFQKRWPEVRDAVFGPGDVPTVSMPVPLPVDEVTTAHELAQDHLQRILTELRKDPPLCTGRLQCRSQKWCSVCARVYDMMTASTGEYGLGKDRLKKEANKLFPEVLALLQRAKEEEPALPPPTQTAVTTWEPKSQLPVWKPQEEVAKKSDQETANMNVDWQQAWEPWEKVSKELDEKAAKKDGDAWQQWSRTG